MRLYWFWSTNPQKVRWALEELGLDVERILVDLFRKGHEEPEFLALNPAGTVPVLVDGEQVICQSNAILIHLGLKTGRLWPSTHSPRIKAHEWLAFEASSLSPQAGTLWFGQTIAPRFGGSLSEERTRRASKALGRHLQHLNRSLEEHPYLLGGFTLVDCAIGIWLAALEATSMDLTLYPHVMRYLSDLQDRPAYLRSDIRYAP